ncbi:hypothetical protein Lal_00036708 [Lupinus albus]|nr:hypothetical protein Lal_00036708 [Lupinus albus]
MENLHLRQNPRVDEGFSLNTVYCLYICKSELVPVLNGTNFEDWKKNMEIVLGCMDLDYALRVEQPPPPLESSTSEERKDYERWERSNCMCLMIIKRDIPEVFRGTVSEKISSAKFFLAEIEKRFAKSDKAETSTLLQNLISMRYQGKGNIREHIMGMSNIVSSENLTASTGPKHHFSRLGEPTLAQARILQYSPRFHPPR